jgi:hypothetical protein
MTDPLVGIAVLGGIARLAATIRPSTLAATSTPAWLARSPTYFEASIAETFTVIGERVRPWLTVATPRGDRVSASHVRQNAPAVDDHQRARALLECER